jgi:ketosteroid isomerase-like protein
MSQQNVEVARRLMAALQSGEHEQALGYLDPSVEFDARTRPDGKVWHGPEGVRSAMADWMDEWDAYEAEAERYVDAGADKVLLLWRERGRGRASGMPLEQEGATVMTLRDGRVSHMRPFVDRAEALKDAGLAD